MTSHHPDGPSSLVRLFVSGAALFVASACGGSLNASASAKADAKGGAEASADAETAWDQVDETQSESDTSANATPSGVPEGGGSSEIALLGARHDLLVGEGAATPCQCLAVVLGQPTSSGIVWTGRRPTTDPNAQMVIALGSDGVACSEEGPGASYMGYVKKDGNVIVTVEAAVAGRPVTHGAIIPRPDPGGQIFVQPHGKIPYGRGPGGEARCALGAGK